MELKPYDLTQGTKNLDVISEITVSYRPEVSPNDRIRIETAKDAYEILRQTWDSGKILFVEEFKILHINAGNRAIGLQYVSMGGMDQTGVDIRVIMATALKSCARGLIIAHNHPSGKLNPSEADLKITKEINKACKLLGLKLMDHIIVTDTDFYSFKNHGLL